MYFIKSPYILSKITGKSVFWKMPEGNNRIFITFDDGPIPEVTPEILKILDKFNAKATFFCVGENVANHTSIYNEILAKGHTTGNHSFNHLNGWKISKNIYLENVVKCESLINSKLFRPPYGKITPAQINLIKNNYYTILWTVLSGDFDKTISNEQCFNNVIKNTSDGSIIVFHDSMKAKEKVIYTLPKVLTHFQKLGFTFESITTEILNEINNTNL